MDKSYWWEKAKEASAQVGWFPTVILAQWQWETGNFKSSNLAKNNNIAGQTWQSWMPDDMKGTARPSAEGGHYIKYADPVIGYVDFIEQNGRYNKVKTIATEEGQIREIAAQGWAVDKNYANGLISVLKANRNQGYVLEDDYMISKSDAKQIVAILGKYWGEMKGSPDIQSYTHHLANEVRKACGAKEDEEL